MPGLQFEDIDDMAHAETDEQSISDGKQGVELSTVPQRRCNRLSVNRTLNSIR